jgi:phosphatidylserine/phosphatidylglycerophosphate/cardiolipin synthase-like enzyme
VGSRAEDRIWLASPFLSKPVAEEIVAAVAESSAVERRLLTALVPGSVQTRVLDPAGLEALLDADFELSSVPNLHAKLSLIDSSWGLVGSGNLTNAGLGGKSYANVELGVTLDAAQIAMAAGYFAAWWDGADPIHAGLIAEYAALPRVNPPLGKPGGYGTPIRVGLPASLREHPRRGRADRAWPWLLGQVQLSASRRLRLVETRLDQRLAASVLRGRRSDRPLPRRQRWRSGDLSCSGGGHRALRTRTAVDS